MAIFLFTGLPGHSKTLNAIRFVDQEFGGKRPIYYHGITDLKLDWHKLDDPKDWYNCPPGSVVFIDECQKVFKPRAPGAAVPVYVSEFETHRHKGFDVVLITQHPNLIDAHVRRLVDTHHHMVRVFGLQAATQYTGTAGVFDPADYHQRNQAIKKRISFDKKYFNVYKSAEVHTVKRRIPLKALVPVFLLLFVGFLGYQIYGSLASMAGGERAQDATGNPGSSSEGDFKPDHTIPAPGGGKAAPLTSEQYAAQLQPRLQGFAFTAPIYDGLREPKSYPWPSCVDSAVRGCRCYSQQATRLDVSPDQCKAIISKGLFDHARAPQDDRGEPLDVVAVHLKAAEIYASMVPGGARRGVGGAEVE